jgi:nucleoside-diphosphate-sugar epimerase
MRKFRNVNVFFGDIRKMEDVSRAIAGQDAVLHLAAILPPVSESNPDLCKSVNVDGTAILIRALQAAVPKPALVSVSSASVMGPTQKRTPPVRPDDPLTPMDNYSRSKIQAENLVEASGLRYCILRLSAVLPTILNQSSLFSMTKLLFDMPLDARCEVVVDLDVANALASAAESLATNDRMCGKRGFIAGGEAQGCQMKTRDLVAVLFHPIGLTIPKESLFSPELDSYYLDWYDTRETQEMLHYQRHSIGQYRKQLMGMIGFMRPLVRLFRPVIMKWIERQSSRYRP